MEKRIGEERKEREQRETHISFLVETETFLCKYEATGAEMCTITDETEH